MATWLHAGLQDGGLTQYGLHKGLSNLGLFSGASLDLRFADTKSLADAVTGQSLVTFTRASSGTYVGSDGLIKTATTNLLLRSEELDNASWSRAGLSSVTANATTAPDGNVTAESLVETTGVSEVHRVLQTISVTSGTTYSASAYFKQEGRRYGYIALGPNATWNSLGASAYIDLQTGTAQSITNCTAVVQALPGSWYRLTITATPTVTNATASITLGSSLSGSTQTYTGDGRTAISVWGAQLEQSSTVGEYIPTTSTINSAPRFDHNPTTGESLGLLVEESRTNLVTYSACDVNWAADSSATYNLGLSALGLFSGVQVTSGGQIWHTIFRPGINLTASVAYAFTVFYRAGTSGRARITFRNNGLMTETVLTGSVGSLGVTTSAAGNVTVLSQYRWSDGLTYIITGTFTPNATNADHWIRIGPDSTTAGQTVIALGAQLEAGSFPTSYIPTTTATVTRSADVASITGSNFGISRTNYIRNNTMVGAVAGTPGTVPTNWIGAGSAGLAREVVGTGTESGIAYVDVRYFGTTTSTLFQSLGFEVTNQITATQNSIWTSTAFVKLVGGSLANITAARLVIDNYNSSNVALGQYAIGNFVPTNAALGTQRYSVSSTSSTFSNAATAFVRPYLQFEANSGAAIDITLRIGLPQLELGSTATAPIPTTSAAVTVVDSSWYRQDEGTVFAESLAPSVNTTIAGFSDGTANERILIDVGTNTKRLVITDNGVAQANINRSYVYGTITKSAAGLKLDSCQFADSGSLGTEDTAVTLPTVDRLNIGANATGTLPLNGTIRRLCYWGQRLPNSTLQALTQ